MKQHIRKRIIFLALPVIVYAAVSFLNTNWYKAPVAAVHADNVCLSPTPSTSTTPTPTPTPIPTIAWSKDRKLTWDDFQGPVPANPPPNIVAQSSVGVSSNWKTKEQCVGAGGGLRKCTVTITEVSAQANFDPSKSWVKPGSKTDALLAHEQGHFDISEIFARKKQEKMNKLIGTSETATACSNEEALKEANKKIEADVMKVCDEINKEEDNMQDQYDKQTMNGTDPDKQKKWQDKIAKMLEKK